MMWKAQPTEWFATFVQVVLSCTRNGAEQAVESKPVAAFLCGVISASVPTLRSCLSFPQWDPTQISEW